MSGFVLIVLVFMALVVLVTVVTFVLAFHFDNKKPKHVSTELDASNADILEHEPASMQRKREVFRSLTGSREPSSSEPTSREPASGESSRGFAALFEKRLGTQLYIWLGGIAIALSAVFLVKYSVDKGLFLPWMRVALAGGVGAILTAAGSMLHRPLRRIAEALCGSGLAAMFAATVAAHHLYHLLPSTVAFAMLASIAGLAVLLSLQQGMFVALLGLVGAFATPMLIRSTDTAATHLCLYLLVVQAALLGTGRRANWTALPLLTLLGVIGWSFIMVLSFGHAAHPFTMSLFATVSALLFAVSPLGLTDEKPASATSRIALTCAAFTWAGGLNLWMAWSGLFTLDQWMITGVLSVACLVLSGFQRRYALLPALMLALSTTGLIGWYFLGAFEPATYGVILGSLLLIHGGGNFVISHIRKPAYFATLSATAAVVFTLLLYPALTFAEVGVTVWAGLPLFVAGLCAAAAWSRFRAVAITDVATDRKTDFAIQIYAIACALLVAIAGIACLSPELRPLAVMGPAAAGIVVTRRLALHIFMQTMVVQLWLGGAYLLQTVLITGLFSETLSTYTAAGLLVAAIIIALLTAMQLKSTQVKGGVVNMQALAVLLWCLGSILIVTMSIQTTSLNFTWLPTGTTVLSMIGLCTAIVLIWLGRLPSWQDMSILSLPIAVISTLLAFNALIPNMLTESSHELQANVFNRWLWLNIWPFFGMLGLWASYVCNRQSERAQFMSWLAIGYLLVTSLMWIRGFTLPLDGSTSELWMLTVVVVTWLSVAVVLSVIFAIWPSLRDAGRMATALTLIAGLAYLVGTLLVLNPLWNDIEVGSMLVWNWFTLALLLPVGLCGVIAWGLRGDDRLRLPRGLVSMAAMAAGLLWMFCVVRQGFAGSVIQIGPDAISQQEWMVHTGLLIGYAVLLLAIGLVTGQVAIRVASAVIMLIAMTKVFFVDALQLEGLARAASFFGLGVTMIVLAYLYQRFVFHTKKPQRLDTPHEHDNEPPQTTVRLSER